MSVGGNMSLPDALAQMQKCVKKGEIDAAQKIGQSAPVCLSLSNQMVPFGSKISEGAESEVYSGTFNGQTVAIKKPFLRNATDLDRFRKEIKILSTLRHPNIVPLLGAKALPPNYFLVMPFLGKNVWEEVHENGWRPSWVDILDIGIQLADAMVHVHGAGMVHRDLKAKNVLRTGEGGIMLVDFGVSDWVSELKADRVDDAKAMIFRRGKPTGGFHKAHMLGTLQYMAPEVLQKNPASFASDVYSFAVTINEVASGIFPFSDCTKDNPDAHTVLEMGYGRQELLAAVAVEGLRPTLPKTAPPQYVQLIQQCWELDPRARPSFQDLVSELQTIKQSLQGTESVPQCVAVDMEVDENSGESGSGVSGSAEEDEEDDSSLDRSSDSCEEAGGKLWVEQCLEVPGNCLLEINSGGFATAGRRGEDRMEDRHFILKEFMSQPGAALLGVFDGHRGYETAQFATELLPGIVSDALKTASNPAEGFKTAFLELEELYKKSTVSDFPDPKGRRYPGCTACTAFVWTDKLVMANAGDCRAVLCRSGEAVQVTRDHTAMDTSERERVQKAGAKVQWRVGSWRVGDAGIQVTRSLGDVDLKGVGVTAEPEVGVVDLTSEDEFLVMATDGLWDSLTNDDVIAIVHDTVKHPVMCAQRLATEAIARGSHDNVSVIVTFLQPVSTLEKVFSQGKSKYAAAAVSQPNLKKPVNAMGAAPDELQETF